MKTFLLAMLMIAAPVFAQDSDQNGAWYAFVYTAQNDHSPWGLQGDWQLRYWDHEARDLQTTMFRNAVTYKWSTHTTLAGGYAHLTRGPYGGELDDKTLEHRTYLEISHWQFTGDFRLQHRVRTEQRWPEAGDFTLRHRYNILAQLDLTGQVYLTGYNEYFVDQNFEFDQNRTKLALGFQITDTTAIHAGYMHQIDSDWQKGQIMFSIYHNF